MDILKNSTDEELVVLFRGGEERAFDELYTRYASRLLRLVFVQVGDRDGAYDVVHDVFLRVIRHIGKFDVSQTFSPWIFKIAINCSHNYRESLLRSGRIEEREKFRLVAEDREGYPSAEEEFISAEDVREFNLAVDTLGSRFREVFLLRFQEGLPYAEIADICGCSQRTVKWRMRRALEYIAEYLKKRKII